MNQTLLNFINALFPNGFNKTENEYHVIIFKDNQGIGTTQIALGNETIHPQKVLDSILSKNGNEALLLHSKPNDDIKLYPQETDIKLYQEIEKILIKNNVKVYNNVVISNNQCTSFKEIGA